MKDDIKNDWEELEMARDFIGNHVNPRDVLIKNLLKDRLFEWLVHKVHEGVRGAHVLDGKGPALQGKRYMVTFITSHHKHRVSLQHSVTFSTDTIEGTNW